MHVREQERINYQSFSVEQCTCVEVGLMILFLKEITKNNFQGRRFLITFSKADQKTHKIDVNQ